MENKQELIIKGIIDKLLLLFASKNFAETIALSIIKRNAGDIIPSNQWSLGNRLIMLASDSMDARGIKQWKAVGRNINKGSKAIYILGPILRKLIQLNDEGEEETRNFLTGFKAIPVFAYEDTNGQELIKHDYSPKEFPPFWEVAEKLGIHVEYAPVSGNFYGKYSLSSNKITLCSQDEFVYYHELAHSIHNTFKPLSSGQNAEQEIIAELSAAVLCELQGISGYQSQAFQYIKSYAEQMNEQTTIKAIMRCLSDVEKIVNIIIETSESITNEVLAS